MLFVGWYICLIDCIYLLRTLNCVRLLETDIEPFSDELMFVGTVSPYFNREKTFNQFGAFLGGVNYSVKKQIIHSA